MVPKQKSCSSVEVGKRGHWEFPASHVPGELRVLDWYQQGLWLGRSRISSGPCRLLQLQQCFNALQPTLSQQPEYFDIPLFWMEHLRKDGCFIVDRRQKNAAQMSNGKAPTMPSSPTQQICGN